MKKFYLIVAALAGAALCGFSQLPVVKDIQRVTLPDEMSVTQAVLSPDGNYVVVSEQATTALTRISLSDGSAMRVADNGSMLNLQISPDNNTVVYRSRTVNKKHLGQTAVLATNLSTGKTVEVAAPSRHLAGFSANGAVANATVNGKLKKKALNGGSSTAIPVVGIYRGHLAVTVDGSTDFIDPQGNGSYLWPSISPDGQRIVYYKAQEGCFTCNLDGSDVRNLGYLHAPVWVNESLVAGMQDIDDGTNVTESAIVITDQNGNNSRLTGPDVIAMYPAACADGSKISFTDTCGNLYIITLE